MSCSCEPTSVQTAVPDARSFQLPIGPGGGVFPTQIPGGGLLPLPIPGGGPMPLPIPGGGVTPLPIPGGGIFPTPIPGGGLQPWQIPGGGILPTPTPGGGVPAQLSQANLPNVLAQFPRPVGQPPAQMVFLFNMLRGNPGMLQSFIQQRPQSLQHAVQLAQTGTMAPRDWAEDERILQGFCYNRWSLIFTFNNVFLMFPVANLFGFVIGYCYPLTPCIVPDFSILFAFC